MTDTMLLLALVVYCSLMQFDHVHHMNDIVQYRMVSVTP